MVVLGIVLIVLAVLIGLGVAVSPYTSTTLEVYGVDFGVAVPTVFFLGAAAGAVCVLGLWLSKKGLTRGYRRHKEVRELRQRAAAAEEPTAGSPAGEPAATADDRAVTADHRTGADDPALATDDRTPDAGRPVTDTDRDRLADTDHTVTDHRQPH